MASVFFADTVNAKARQTSATTSIILASPCDDRKTIQASSAYSIPPHRTTNVVRSWLRSHRRRGLHQVHQPGKDGRIPAESLEDNIQRGCEEDVEHVGIRGYLILSRGRIMEQLRFSMGLVAYFIQYCRVILSRHSRTLLLSVFLSGLNVCLCLVLTSLGVY